MNYKQLEKHCDEWFGTNADKKQHITQIIAAMVDLLKKVEVPLTSTTVLVAIDECEMEDAFGFYGDDTRTLTIGKEYEVIEENNEKVVVIDDCGHHHEFQKVTLSKFFNTPYMMQA